MNKFSSISIKQQNALRKEAIGSLTPVVLPNIVQEHKTNITNILRKEAQGPVRHSKVYDKYISLITKKADEEVEQFLKEDHSFNEYEKELKKYQRLSKEITYNSQKIAKVGMFELHCDELNRSLAKRAEHLMNKLLDRMLTEHFELNKQ